MYPEIPASVFNHNRVGNISIYPNPTDGLVTVAADQMNEAIYCTVSDLSGKRIIRTENAFGNLSTDVSGLNAGVYLMRVFLADGTPVAAQKLVRK
jgi:hypothetical protein